jgi:hypothetical protein
MAIPGYSDPPSIEEASPSSRDLDITLGFAVTCCYDISSSDAKLPCKAESAVIRAVPTEESVWCEVAV